MSAQPGIEPMTFVFPVMFFKKQLDNSTSSLKLMLYSSYAGVLFWRSSLFELKLVLTTFLCSKNIYIGYVLLLLFLLSLFLFLSYFVFSEASNAFLFPTQRILYETVGHINNFTCLKTVNTTGPEGIRPHSEVTDRWLSH